MIVFRAGINTFQVPLEYVVKTLIRLDDPVLPKPSGHTILGTENLIK